MNYRDREGKSYHESTFQDRFLKLMYGTLAGRCVVRLLSMPAVSKLGGAFLSSPASKVMIRPFIEKNHIDMSEYIETDFSSYNDFFIRRIKKERRPIDQSCDAFISPSDGKLSLYQIDKNSVFKIKNSWYTVHSLLRNKKLASKFIGGYCFLIRLTVDNYHRYCYVDNGLKSKNYFIPGKLHTVNPAALDFADIYKENSREYTLIRTEHFGDIVQMEVGAMMVGKIVNNHQRARIYKGQEKGYFQFGGSTVILLVPKNKVSARLDLLKNMKDGYETIVHMGEAIGYKL